MNGEINSEEFARFRSIEERRLTDLERTPPPISTTQVSNARRFAKAAKLARGDDFKKMLQLLIVRYSVDAEGDLKLTGLSIPQPSEEA